MKIHNAKCTPLNERCGTVVDVSGALMDTFQPMVFQTTTKTVIGFQILETPTTYCFQGNWQILSAAEIVQKPEGQRNWAWFAVFAQPSLILVIDQIINYLGVQYRVMRISDWRINGYIKYELIEDYTGIGP